MLGSALEGVVDNSTKSAPKCLYKNHPSVETLVNKVLEGDPTNSFACRTKAAVLLEQGQKEAASKVLLSNQVLNLLVTTDPTRRNYYQWLSQLCKSEQKAV